MNNENSRNVLTAKSNCKSILTIYIENLKMTILNSQAKMTTSNSQKTTFSDLVIFCQILVLSRRDKFVKIFNRKFS